MSVFTLAIDSTNTIMLQTILVVKIGWIPCITVLLQASKVNPLTATYCNRQSFSSSFSSHTQAWACGLWFNLFDIFIFLISQPYPIRFQWNLSYPLQYAYPTSTAIFRLILLCSITPQHTLCSRVKDSITHNLTVILCSNFNGILLAMLM